MATTTINNQQIIECIKNCEQCAQECFRCMNHCLGKGGDHASLEHQRIMQDCATICATSANFMSRGSEHHAEICGVCAEICKACGDSCGRMADGDQQMERCAKACRTCEESCRSMSS